MSKFYGAKVFEIKSEFDYKRDIKSLENKIEVMNNRISDLNKIIISADRVLQSVCKTGFMFDKNEKNIVESISKYVSERLM